MTQLTPPSALLPSHPVGDFLFVAFRHKKKILATFAAVLAVTVYVTTRLPDVFQSEAKLYIKPGRESVVDPVFREAGDLSSAMRATMVQLIKSELEILKSQGLAEEVVDVLGPEGVLGPKPAPEAQPESEGGLVAFIKEQVRVLLPRQVPLTDRDQAVATVLRNLKATNPRETNNIHLTYEAGDPHMAQKVLIAVVDAYKVRHAQVHKTKGSFAFLEGKFQSSREVLAAAETRLKDLKSSTGFATLEQRRRSQLERTQTLRAELAGAQADLEGLRARLGSLRRLVEAQPEMVISSQLEGGSGWNASERMRERLFDLELREQELLSKFAPESELVKEVQRQIEALRAIQQAEAPRSQLTKGLNALRQRLLETLLTGEAEEVALAARAAVLDQQYAAANQDLEALDRLYNETDYEVSQLQREIDLERENYQRYRSSYEQALIAEETEKQKISSITEFQPATGSLRPVRPNRLMNLAVGLLLALFGGFGLAYAFELLDRTFRRPFEVEPRLGVPLMASIPKVRGSRMPGRE